MGRPCRVREKLRPSVIDPRARYSLIENCDVVITGSLSRVLRKTKLYLRVPRVEGARDIGVDK